MTKLRIGLLMNSLEVNAWEHVMLKKIAALDFVEIVLVAANDSPGQKKSIFRKIFDNWKYLLFFAWTFFDEKRTKVSPDAFARVSAKNLLSGVPVLNVRPRQTRFSDFFEDADIAEIKRHDVDVFVRMGFRILRGKILSAAKFGVWSFHHGDYRVNRGAPPGFWEVFLNEDVTGSVLQILNENLDNGLVLAATWSSTNSGSPRANRNNYYWKTLSLLPRKLDELHRDGEEKFFENARQNNRHIAFYSNRLYTKPANKEMLRLLAGHYWNSARALPRKLLYFQQWILLFDLKDGISESFREFKKMIPPKERFWADPHPIYKDGKYYIFLEEFEYRTGKGHIALIEMDEIGAWKDPVTVLKPPHHLSYPFVFEWENEWYMIPDSASNRSIDIYKCAGFPGKWEFYKTLMTDLYAVDTTLLNHGGKWWLFANIRENEGASSFDELFLFYADSPLSSDWTPHPRNPIVSDVRRARPAGRIFEHNGRLLRPSQNSSKDYGYGIKINEIDVLDQTEYNETVLSSIEPNWENSITGTHTFNHAHRLTIIDGKMRRYRFL